MRNDDGFTLVELLAIIAVTAILLTLGAWAVRNFWLVRSLTGAEDEVVTQLRAVQSRATAEGRIYGIGFVEAGGLGEPSDRWELVRYDSAGCVSVGRRDFDAGVLVHDAQFTTEASGQDLTAVAAACSAVVPARADAFAFFLPRGTATAGFVTMTQPNLDPQRYETVLLDGLTGRVDEELDPEYAIPTPTSSAPVALPSPSASATPTPTPSATPTPTPSASPTPSRSPTPTPTPSPTCGRRGSGKNCRG